MNVIDGKNIIKNYGKQCILKSVNYSAKEGTFNVILGQSGSGKSTLLNILSGLMPPDEGQVMMKDKDIYQSPESLLTVRREYASNIFQDYLLLPDLNVMENIRLGEIKKKHDEKYFMEVVKELKIDSLLSHFPDELSGGQKQRVAIARALMKKPSIIFCDEATGALDEENSKIVVSILHKIKKDLNTAIIFTTHNNKIGKTADRVTVIRDGEICEDIWNDTPLSPEEMEWGIEI